MNIEILEAFTEEFQRHGGWLGSATLKATAGLLLAAVAIRLLRMSSASFRHALAVMAVLGVPAIFVLDLSPIPGEFGWRPFALDQPANHRELVGQVTISAGDVAMPEAQAHGADLRAESVVPTSSVGLLVGVWWVGLGIASIRFLRRLRRPRFVVVDYAEEELSTICRQEATQLGLRRHVALQIAEKAMPMTFGLFKPVIVLPAESASWSRERRVSILRHELVHVRRRDLWWSLLVEAALLPLWWHPLARWMKREVVELTEQACDDAVISAGSAPVDYAGDLLALSRQYMFGHSSCLALPAISGKSQVARFRRVLDAGASRCSVSLTRVLTMGLLVLALIVPGTLLVSCSATTESKVVNEVAVAPTSHPKIPGVRSGTEQLRIMPKFFEATVVEGGAFDDPKIVEWIEGKRLLLSPNEGFRLFHPHRKSMDVMTAPSVVCEGGQTVKVEVLRELIFPTKFEKDPQTGKETDKPVAFETRTTGVILEVSAQATNNPSVVRVALKPSVTEQAGVAKDDHGHELPQFRVLTRSYSGLYPNGSYLCLGVKEDIQDIHDKVPLLGDVPLIGRLFSSSETRTTRRVIAVQVIVAESKPDR